MSVGNEILNLKEAAEFLHISPRALREAAARGDVPGRQIARQWRFSREALRHWLGGNGPANPLLRHAGALKDNALWPEVMAYIEAERERQRAEAAALADAEERETAA